MRRNALVFMTTSNIQDLCLLFSAQGKLRYFERDGSRPVRVRCRRTSTHQPALMTILLAFTNKQNDLTNMLLFMVLSLEQQR